MTDSPPIASPSRRRSSSGRELRHLARLRALQALFAFEFAAPDEPPEQVERAFLGMHSSHRRQWRPLSRELVEKVRLDHDALDTLIAPLLRHWDIERIPLVDRICLRMALCELHDFHDIPLRVTINEYIELVREFSGEESCQYVNAVLDRLAQNLGARDFQASSPKKPPREEPSL